MQELAKVYREHTGEIGARYREAIKGFPRQYESDLRGLMARYQREGNLDGVLNVAREQKRFAEAMQGERDPFEMTPEMPDSALVREPAELRRLQEQYVQRFKDAAAERQKAVNDLTAKYLSRLEALQRELTRAGRIREAIIVKREVNLLGKGIADDTLAQLLDELPATSGDGDGAVGTMSPIFGAVPNWARWDYAGSVRFARERTQYDHPDVPNELYATFNARTGKGRIHGRCAIDTRTVGPVLSAWFGKALLWRIADPSTLTATIQLDSRELSAGREHGPQAQLALLAEGSPLGTPLDVPLYARETILRVVKDPRSNQCALMWPEGKQTTIVTLPDQGDVELLLGIVVRNPGELCDTSIELAP